MGKPIASPTRPRKVMMQCECCHNNSIEHESEILKAIYNIEKKGHNGLTWTCPKCRATYLWSQLDLEKTLKYENDW